MRSGGGSSGREEAEESPCTRQGTLSVLTEAEESGTCAGIPLVVLPSDCKESELLGIGTEEDVGEKCLGESRNTSELGERKEE